MRKLLLTGIICLSLCFLHMTGNVHAFSFGTNETPEERMDKLEESLNMLEKEVYKNLGKKAPERKPYMEEVEFSGDNIEIRIAQIESKLRELTGLFEEAKFNTDKVVSRIDKLSNEINWRLAQLEKAAGINSANFSPMEKSVEQEEVKKEIAEEESGDGSKVLGILHVDSDAEKKAEVMENNAQEKEEVSETREAGPKYEYDQAFSTLRQSKYKEAAEAFHNFITKYPKHELVSNAYYWLGESFYVRKDYEQASVAFLQGYQADTKGDKSPDNLLKLAMSMNGLGKKKEACATFDKLNDEFPGMSSTIKRRVEKERELTGCR